MESSFSALENFTRAQQWAEEEVDHSLEHPWRGVVEESGLEEGLGSEERHSY